MVFFTKFFFNISWSNGLILSLVLYVVTCVLFFEKDCFAYGNQIYLCNLEFLEKQGGSERRVMINLGWALFLKKKKNDLTKLTTNELRKIGKYFHHLLSFLKKQNCLRKLKKHYKIRKICCFELVCIYKYTYYFSMHSIIFFYEDYKIWWYLCNQTDNFSNEPTLNSRLSKKNVSLLYNRHFV